jgi:hypothetical protein
MPAVKTAEPDSGKSATTASVGSGARSDAGDLASFAAAYREEANGLAEPTRLYVVREQQPPRPFRDFSAPGRAPARVHDARMFAFDFADAVFGDCSRVTASDGTFCTSAVYPGVPLTPEQTQRAVTLAWPVDAGPPGTRAVGRCFEPHHAVVFLDDRGVPVGEATVCFECRTMHVAPGSGEDLVMNDAEAGFFADLCRSTHVGGCPPEGAVQMPDLPPAPEESLSMSERDRLFRARAFGRSNGISAGKRLVELSAHERELLCLWLMSAVRHGRTFACADGRKIAVEDWPACPNTRPAPECASTVADFERCARSRLEGPCGVDAPECARLDRCRWAVSVQ